MRLGDYLPINRRALDKRITVALNATVTAAVLPRLRSIERRHAALEQTIATLGARMTAAENALADLDAATNEVATELEDLRDQVAGVDSALAARITAAANRLRGLATDPDNPVPDVPAEDG